MSSHGLPDGNPSREQGAPCDDLVVSRRHDKRDGAPKHPNTGAGIMAVVFRHLVDAHQCAVEMFAMMMCTSRMTGTR